MFASICESHSDSLWSYTHGKTVKNGTKLHDTGLKHPIQQNHGVPLVPNVKPLYSHDVPIGLVPIISQNISKGSTIGPRNAKKTPKTVDM